MVDPHCLNFFLCSFGKSAINEIGQAETDGHTARTWT